MAGVRRRGAGDAALSRFYPPFPLHGTAARYAINASYYAAQLLLALGFSRVVATLPERHVAALENVTR